MITLVVVVDNGVALHHLSVCEYFRFLSREQSYVIGIVTFLKFHYVVVGIFKPKDIIRIFYNRIFLPILSNNDSIADNLEVCRLRNRVGIVYGVAFGTEVHFLGVAVNPHALKCRFGIRVLDLCRSFLVFLTTAAEDSQ